MPKKQLSQVLDAELGPEWKSKLTSFDYEPLAAASIGQVITICQILTFFYPMCCTLEYFNLSWESRMLLCLTCQLHIISQRWFLHTCHLDQPCFTPFYLISKWGCYKYRFSSRCNVLFCHLACYCLSSLTVLTQCSGAQSCNKRWFGGCDENSVPRCCRQH